MPERRVSSEIWTKRPFFQLSMQQKLLSLYLEINQHCNPAGVYQLPIDIIAIETKIPAEDIPAILSSLAPSIEWYENTDTIWVKDFIKKQSFSPKFFSAAGKCLQELSNDGLAAEVVKYNQDVHGIAIPYQYPLDTQSIGPIPQPLPLSNTNASSKSSSRGVKKGGDELAIISRLFEENVGTITPVVKEQLLEVAENYPQGWFGAALKEAVANAHVNLKYILAIMNRWAKDGFQVNTKKGKKHNFDNERMVRVNQLLREFKKTHGREPSGDEHAKIVEESYENGC